MAASLEPQPKELQGRALAVLEHRAQLYIPHGHSQGHTKPHGLENAATVHAKAMVMAVWHHHGEPPYSHRTTTNPA